MLWHIELNKRINVNLKFDHIFWLTHGPKYGKVNVRWIQVGIQSKYYREAFLIKNWEDNDKPYREVLYHQKTIIF